jgi:uncharacterized protein (DUF1800 family)
MALHSEILMRHSHLIPLLLAPLAMASSATAPQSSRTIQDEAIPWGEREVEHLWNRAGFGAATEQVQTWAGRSQAELIDHLMAPREIADPFPYEIIARRRDELKKLGADERRAEQQRIRKETRRQAGDFVMWWVDRMITDVDPLGERMTLFWHGHFTSSLTTVKQGHLMIQQNELLREHALGNYGVMLRGVLKDPAMIRYLDNNSNRKGRPNENLAREVMELFSLGEGNYSEDDIKDAARALSGHTAGQDGKHRFVPRQHDFGEKTILGVTGRHDLDDLVDILLEQDACSRWIAERLLTYFEGAAPSLDRIETYSRILEENGMEMRPTLRSLFQDPDFYRAEIVGAKVLSPIDYLVGVNRRLGSTTAPLLVSHGASTLGQKLFDPPNVKGWEGGFAWISTSTLMQRGNLAGMMLGVINMSDLRSDEELDEMMDSMDEESMDSEMEMDEEPARRRTRDEMSTIARAMSRFEYKPRLNLRARLSEAEAFTDARVVDVMLRELLAIEVPTESAEPLITWFQAEREALELPEEALLRRRKRGIEDLLRRLAHKILSLPEAQLG